MGFSELVRVGWAAAPALASVLALALQITAFGAGQSELEASFRKQIQPILQEHCSDCHADGMKKGGVAFDEFKSASEWGHPDLWLKVLKNVRAGLMPPPKKDQPSLEEKQQLEDWIKQSVFAIDPKNPDPGRRVIRRLNRIEYRNTMRDLMGVDFDTEKVFPPDDTGHGFDNIASVLTISPMLMEKYIEAATQIVTEAVPQVSKVVAEQRLDGKTFASPSEEGSGSKSGSISLSYYEEGSASNRVEIQHGGEYEVVLNLTAAERYVDNQFDYNKCLMTFFIDGEQVIEQEFNREGSKPFVFKFKRDWNAGEHTFALKVRPLTQEKEIRSLNLRLNSVVVRGPFDEERYVAPKDYQRFFPKAVPEDEGGRRLYAREYLQAFAERAFRAPVDGPTVNRLAELAESVYTQPKQTFEAGISQAMIAVLASPRFLFREERIALNFSSEGYPLIDEYSLATRLSYFLWSSMPDADLIEHARAGTLRKNLGAQVDRMLANPNSEQLIRNFSGQWLQARDIEKIQIDARAVLRREENSASDDRQPRDRRGRGRRIQLDDDLRSAMRQETERYFAHIVREDRSVLELIDSDYTFLNERLAAHYGLTNLNVNGSEMRLVKLPADSPRGGVLTHGTVLVVTSNPTRTSPVKRGVFLLENILGTPPPPPPPDLPSLEEAGKQVTNRVLTLRETLEIHRSDTACSSCHNRMDPLGLALESFNAMGMWRTEELGQPVDTSGKLISGESFEDIRELRKILAHQHRGEFYETITDKLLVYALGRGLEYYDVGTVDSIVHRLEKEDGRFSALLMGIIESAPFQRSRKLEPKSLTATSW